MESMKWTMEAIRVRMDKTRAEMAEAMDITLDRYNRLVSGESRMFALELIKLHEISKVPYSEIEVTS